MNFYQSTEDLISKHSVGSNPLIICPSPLVADGLRRLLPLDFEMITISKWVGDYLKSQNLKRSNKSELMLRLSSVWRHYFPNEQAHLFFKAFELFTDLRSFSLNLELISEFLKEIDPVTTKSILIFWTFLQNEKIIDEHQSYRLQSDQLIERPIWIIGFKHLSGVQIDMLKTIGEKTDVVVFFPKEIYQDTFSTDWIRWLAPEEKVEIDENKIKNKLKIIYFPKNKLNIVLNSFKEKINNFDIAIATAGLTFNNKQEVQTNDQFFKSPEDLFCTRREKLLEELANEMGEASYSIAEFSLSIENKKKFSLEKEDFILYKTLLLLQESLSFYGEFQTTVDLFSLKVFKIILELDSPRVSLITLAENTTTRILELNELPYRKSKYPLIITASSNYGALKATESKYSEKMIDALKVIAPIKRSGLDFLYTKNEMVQVLSKENSFLIIEEGLELIDLAWREILKDFELELVDIDADYSLKEKKDYLCSKIKLGPYPVKNFSASRIQNFLDCPRKYYFSYVEKLEHRPEERMKLASDEMGIIEHLIIEKYFKNKTISSALSFDASEHELLCSNSLNEFLSANKIKLSDKVKLVTYYELLHYSQNGIEFLLAFCKIHSAVRVIFEQPIGNNPMGLVGSIDCLVELNEKEVALFDFKRSAAAIGSKKETMAFDKIQIWLYLLSVIRHLGKDIHSWGYLNLSDINSSQIYNEKDVNILSEKILDDFQAVLLAAMDDIKKEINFLALPRSNKVCNFCEVQLFCDKGSCS